jgi:hypothetical protein
MIAERIDSVAVSKDLPAAELDARFSFVVNIRDQRKTEIADATKILGTADYGDIEDRVEARLTDEQPESFYLVKDVEEGQQPFRLYALERFTVVGEKGNDYVVDEGCYKDTGCIKVQAEFPGGLFTNFHRRFQLMRWTRAPNPEAFITMCFSRSRNPATFRRYGHCSHWVILTVRRPKFTGILLIKSKSS